MPSKLVPVSLRNAINTGSWDRKAMPVKIIIKIESTKRSVTTVPNDFVKDTPSHFFSVPQRVISPTRGTTKLAAYDMKIASVQDVRLGCSPNGSRAIFHRHARAA